MEEDGRQRTRPPRESFLVVQEYWVVWSRTRIQDFEHRGGYSRPRGAVTVELADSALLPRDLPLHRDYLTTSPFRMAGAEEVEAQEVVMLLWLTGERGSLDVLVWTKKNLTIRGSCLSRQRVSPSAPQRSSWIPHVWVAQHRPGLLWVVSPGGQVIQPHPMLGL